MARRVNPKEFFESLLAGGVADGLVTLAAEQFPIGAKPQWVASQCIAYLLPICASRLWDRIRAQSPSAAAAELERIAQLSTAEAQAIALEAVRAVTPAIAQEQQRRALTLFLASISSTLRQALPKNKDGRSVCSPASLPKNENETCQMLPQSIAPFWPPCDLPESPYQLDDFIAVGGFGAVYAASIKTESVKRAIKVCLDPLYAASLRKEAAVLRDLESHSEAWKDKIVRLYGSKLDADPPYLVYEHVEGGDLAAFLRGFSIVNNGRTPTPSQAIQIVRRIAECIEPAHALGIAHRDIKPGNVLWNGEVFKVTDFGLAHVPSNPHHARSQRTRVSSAHSQFRGAGTLMYMCRAQRNPSAPSRAGSAPPTSFDVYAIGIIWYQLLIGDFQQEMGPSWEAELTQLGVPRKHIGLLRKMVFDPAKLDSTGSTARPADAASLIREIDAVLSAASKTAKRRRREMIRREKDRARKRAERAERIGVLVGGGLLGSIVFGAYGALLGYGAGAGWNRELADATMLSSDQWIGGVQRAGHGPGIAISSLIGIGVWLCGIGKIRRRRRDYGFFDKYINIFKSIEDFGEFLVFEILGALAFGAAYLLLFGLHSLVALPVMLWGVKLHSARQGLVIIGAVCAPLGAVAGGVIAVASGKADP